MARRKRKEDEPIWKPPEFDEVEYMRREIESAKVAVVTIAWAVVGAIIAYLLYAFVPFAGAIVGFFAGLATFGALYFVLPVLGLPIHGFKTRDWLGNFSVYFFSWLAFWILILNPPFGDHTPPTVSTIVVSSAGSTAPAAGSLICTAVSRSPMQITTGSNTTLYLLFRATDNVGVTRVAVTVNGASVSPTEVSGQSGLCSSGAYAGTFPPSTYLVTVAITTNQFTLSVTAWDAAGLSSTGGATIQT